MPYKTVEDLPASVRDILPTAAQKIYLSVFNDVFGPDCGDGCAAAKAMAAAKRSITNMVVFNSIDNAIGGKHDVVLQRLDTLIKNGGKMILYTPEAFQNVSDWVGVPVVYVQTEGGTVRHPSQNDVVKNTLPEGYRVVGRVIAANMGPGEPSLRGEIEIDDPALDTMAAAGQITLSTGFSASVANVNGQDKIVGNVVPNHVLIFKRGACRNCYPNDNSARFENTQQEEDDMDDESKSFLKKIVEKLENLKAPEPATPPQKEEVKDMDELKNVRDERDALKAKIEAIENAAVQAARDTAWSEMKNALPVGWLGDKETDTRKEFETNPAAFSVKFAKFSAENSTPPKSAEGDEAGKPGEDTAKQIEMKNLVADMGKRTGFVLVGGDE